ncbi:PD-(D/E)XK nuclease family protein, partial [bacterium]|nr:PD-(D/E)XK nuclease family protein [bacterium]
LPLGSALHNAHAFMRASQQKREPVVLDDARQVFAESYDVLASNPIVEFSDESEREAHREAGFKYVALIHADLRKDEVLAVEEPFEVPLVDPGTGEVLDRPLKGVLDLVCREPDGSLVVVDLKTAATRYSPDRLRTDLQATLYSYAATILYPERAAFRFDVVLKARTPRFEHVYVTRGEEDYRRMIGLVRIAERAIEAGVFVPSDGFYCQGCGFKRSCRSWTGRVAAA